MNFSINFLRIEKKPRFDLNIIQCYYNLRAQSNWIHLISKFRNNQTDHDRTNQFVKRKHVFVSSQKQQQRKQSRLKYLMSLFEVCLFWNRMLQSSKSSVLINGGTVKSVCGTVIDSRKPLVDVCCFSFCFNEVNCNLFISYDIEFQRVGFVIHEFTSRHPKLWNCARKYCN